MNRVTIKDVYRDFAYAAVSNDVKNIEVVPRKMVEMIIEYCKRESEINDYHDAVRIEAYEIQQYAESLLKQFEEEKKENE